MIQALLQRYEKKIERRKLEKRTAFGACFQVVFQSWQMPLIACPILFLQF